MWTFAQSDPTPLWRPNGARSTTLIFSSRLGGVSDAPYDTLNIGRSTEDRPEHVAENRRRLLVAAGLDPERVATAGQVHGATVTHAVEPRLHPECDALATTQPGLALAVTGADCLPILLAAPGGVAVAHCGWRGAEARIPAAAVRALAELAGCAASAIEAHLGPCIRACCYTVGSDVFARFPVQFHTEHPDGIHLDLAAAARADLVAAGIRPDAVHDVDQCTACSPHRYFSHRRDRGLTGRQWGVAAMPAPGA
jgi:YfiH family protein